MESETHNFKFYPEEHGLIPFARTHSRTTLLFDLNKQLIVITDMSEFEENSMGIAELLFNIAAKNISIGMLDHCKESTVFFQPMHHINHTFNDDKPYVRPNPNTF